MIAGYLILFIFIADLWAITTIFNSGVTAGSKVFWCLLVFLLPVLGFILSYLAGPEDESLLNGFKKSISRNIRENKRLVFEKVFVKAAK
jgi:hypothetical protein